VARKARGDLTGVYERSPGHWAYVVTLPKGGRRKQQWVSGFTTAEAAIRARRKRLVELDEGIATQPATATVAETLTRWLAMREFRAGNTWMNYERVIRLHIVPHIGAIPLTRLTPEDVGRVAQAAPRSCLVHVRAVLRQALDQAVRFGHVSRNVATLVTWPVYHQPEMAHWPEATARQFLVGIQGDPWELAFRLLLATGMRRGELLALRWFDVDLKRGWLSVHATLGREQHSKHWAVQEFPKTAAGRRTFQVDATTLGLLRAAERRSEWLLSDAAGQWRKVDALDRAWHRLCTQAGVPRIRLHDLRHTHVVLARLAGEPWERIAQRIGHSSTGITQARYGHISPAMLEDSAEVLGRVFG
jgi:integrase